MPDECQPLHNINVGVLGHVDSGKTSLVAALSTKLSTAALDKHPQSKERGITLDLGFSSFTVPMPARLIAALPCRELQFTLVDCPGHASLIRTIIGGAQIIDMMLLVIDVTKGIQAQTAECLVVGEIATQHMVVVINKVDLLPAELRHKLVVKACKRLAQTFAATTFAGCPMVAVSAKPGGGDGPAPPAEGVPELIGELVKMVPAQPRLVRGPFLFSADHCFLVKGQGTVLTGTVLSGSAEVGGMVELPELRVVKKVKSMQVFRQPVSACRQGDRAGICVTQLDASTLERTLLCTPGSVPTFTSAIAAVEKVRFFSGTLPSKGRVHVSLGHCTLMAEVTYFGTPDGSGHEPAAALRLVLDRIGQLALNENVGEFDYSTDYAYQHELHGLEGRPSASGRQCQHYGPQWALLKFSQPVTAPKDALVIGSRFDTDVSKAACRLAFYGRLVALLRAEDPSELAHLRIFKLKMRAGSIDRVAPDGFSAVCKGMFKKDTDISLFAGMKVTTASGAVGTIEGSFGKSGKFKVAFPKGIVPAAPGHNSITLTFKRYIYDQNKRNMVQ
ncbi:g1890 [Coccomyxa elongata]